jgi:drug/metabolite transporter (DMT)-like permease
MYEYLYVLFLVLFLILIETGSQYNLKLYNVAGISHNLLFGMVGYIIVALILTYSYNYGKMGIVNHLWNIGSSISVFIVGYLYFNEKLNKMQTIGVIFGLFGMILMGMDQYMNHDNQSIKN